MPWNNVYLDSGSSVPTTSHASVQGRLSVASNVSITGNLLVAGTISTPSAFSSGAQSLTSMTATGVVSIGGGFPLSLVTRGRQVVTTLTAVATKSTETTWTNQLVALGDVVVGSCMSSSGISAGLAWNMSVSAASTINLRISNVSAANASMDSATWQYWVLR